jgi:hypothetical protein
LQNRVHDGEPVVIPTSIVHARGVHLGSTKCQPGKLTFSGQTTTQDGDGSQRLDLLSRLHLESLAVEYR